MKARISLSGALLLPLLISGVVCGQVSQDGRTIRASTRLQLTAELDPPRAAPGAQVFLNVTLKNIHSKTVHLDSSLPQFDYRIAVANAAGKEPPRTEWGEKLLRREAFALSQDVLNLVPGQEVRARVEVTKAFQFAKAGTYYLRVSRDRVWTEYDEESKKFVELVYSNPVQLTIAQ